MKKINSGKLRAIGYDAKARILQVQFDNGNMLQHSGVGEDLWRRFSSSGAAWSFYRDNIEEEFAVKKVSEMQWRGKIRWMICSKINEYLRPVLIECLLCAKSLPSTPPSNWHRFR